MRILYISTLCAEKTYQALFGRGSRAPGRAAQKYHRVMTSGLAENSGTEVLCITAPPVSRANCPRKYIAPGSEAQGKVRFRYAPVINYPILKNISAYLQVKKACLRELRALQQEGTEDGLAGMVCDLLCGAACAGALAAQKKFNRRAKRPIRSVGIVTDLPDFLEMKPKRLFDRLFEKNLAACSAYVFLTEAMNERLNPAGKPYTVIEGQADPDVPEPPAAGENGRFCGDATAAGGSGQTRSDAPAAGGSGRPGGSDPASAGSIAPSGKRICLYAGSLHRQYGIEMLVNAFRSLAPENAELHIYGTGDYLGELQKITESGGPVRYCGVLPGDEIVKKEQEAILLINPRPGTGEFTRYSFPSKNIEYMASGTAVLTAALPGMPAEYTPYVYIFEDESEAGLKKKLEELLAKSDNELRGKGLAARRFVLENKNGKIQAGKVLALLK